MKIALTADLHLAQRDRHLERYQTLIQILDTLVTTGTNTLIIAGDLFDASMQNYSDFEQICRLPKYQSISIYIIPGNHDPSIDNKKIVADNITIFSEPTIKNFGDRLFFFLPYHSGKSMGEVISEYSDILPTDEWVLVGHGDWASGLRIPNPTEPGVYMPLTRRDIETYQPTKVFLGHIHSIMDTPIVHYIGSPCGLDITETGRRRFLEFDTITGQINQQIINTPVVYFNESFVVMPVDNEVAHLQTQIDSCLTRWQLTSEEKDKAIIRIRVRGYSANREALLNTLQANFGEFNFYKDERINIDNVSIADDVERSHIAQQVQASLSELEWPNGSDEPDTDDIMLATLTLIYGG